MGAASAIGQIDSTKIALPTDPGMYIQTVPRQFGHLPHAPDPDTSPEAGPGVYMITTGGELNKGEYALYLARGEGMAAYVYDFGVHGAHSAQALHRSSRGYEGEERPACWPQLLRLHPPPGADRPKQLLCLAKFLASVTSYGELPVVVYQPSECGQHHGNFISASYKAILRKPEWRKRLQKVHTQGTFAACSGRIVVRTRFFTELRRAADEHLLLPRRHAENGGLRNFGNRKR
jgi:hypothetical protein